MFFFSAKSQLHRYRKAFMQNCQGCLEYVSLYGKHKMSRCGGRKMYQVNWNMMLTAETEREFVCVSKCQACQI